MKISFTAEMEVPDGTPIKDIEEWLAFELGYRAELKNTNALSKWDLIARGIDKFMVRAGMTDLEMTKKCAEAIGYRVDADGGFSRLQQGAGMDEPDWFEFIYDPLRDDAQAMALVKKFRLIIEPDGTCAECDYWAASWVNAPNRKGSRSVAVRKAISINHAIVECVAKMQETK